MLGLFVNASNSHSGRCRLELACFKHRPI